jgi:hypothetical protein
MLLLKRAKFNVIKIINVTVYGKTWPKLPGKIPFPEISLPYSGMELAFGKS